MPLMGNWLLVQRLVTTALYNLLRIVFIAVQRIYWQLNGTAQKLRESRLAENYDRSAHVLDVVLFHKFCPGQNMTVDNFLCVHNRFENPQYIVDSEHVTLMMVTEQDAIFCEAQEKDMRLWRGEYSPFIRYAQMKHCRRLIVVPLSTFHRLAQLIGDPAGQLVFLFNTTRCGSTLLTQIMENTGRCVALSEPNAPYSIAAKYRKYGDTPELRQLARDVIRWECRPYPTMQPPPLGYFLKLVGPIVHFLPMLRDLFPSSRCLFMYRDVLSVAKSTYRLSIVLPSLRLAVILGRISGHFTKIIVDANGFDGTDYRVRLDSGLTGGVLLSAVTTSYYLDMRRRGWDVSALRYEDLVERPLDMCRVVLEYCRLPASLAELAVRAFDVDALRNSILAKSVIGNLKEPQLTPHRKTRLNQLLSKHGMPLIGEPGTVEGTLSCS